MGCIKLFSGQETGCEPVYKKYFQQAVLINKSDVESFITTATIPNAGAEVLSVVTGHRIRFKLKEGKKGFRFQGEPNGISFFATWSKEMDENIPQYNHFVQLPIFGASERAKQILKTLDNADYFAAIQFTNGLVEIYGFENGLTTDDYNVDLQSNLGGVFVNLISPPNGLEDEPPLIYVPGTGGSANEDFNNLFEDIPDVVLGDFNDDFNNDFDVTNG